MRGWTASAAAAGQGLQQHDAAAGERSIATTAQTVGVSVVALAATTEGALAAHTAAEATAHGDWGGAVSLQPGTPTQGDGQLYDGTTPQAANQPVVSEFYDEVVFTDPRTEFHAELMNATKQPMEPHPLNAHFTTFEDAPEVETLVKAGEYVAGQLQTVKDSIARLDHQIGLARQLEQSRAAQEHAAHQQAAAQQAAQQQRAQAQRAAQPGYK